MVKCVHVLGLSLCFYLFPTINFLIHYIDVLFKNEHNIMSLAVVYSGPLCY